MASQILPVASSNKPTPVSRPDRKDLKPVVARAKKVATVLEGKPLLASKASIKAKPFFIGKIWEQFCQIFKNAFRISNSETEVTPIERFDPFDLWPKTPTIPKPLASPPQIDLPCRLNNLAKILNRTKETTESQEVYKPEPQTNLGNSCYMNSALQLLQNCYLQHDEACNELIKQDLSMRPGETLKELEERVLYVWAPINDLPDTALLDGQENVDEKWSLQENAAILDYKEKQTFLDRDARILFKFSYLLLLQAKMYGQEDSITKALKYHHQAVFALNSLELPFKDRSKQLEAASYLTLWHEVLNIGKFCFSSYSEALLKNGKTYRSDRPNIEEVGAINMIACNENGTVDRSLTKFVDRYFSERIVDVKNQWKPADDLSFADYTKKKRIIGSPPPFLQVAMGRFRSDNTGLNQKKIVTKIPFDRDAKGNPIGSFTDPIDLSQYFAPEYVQKDSAEYELIGIVRHEGSSIHRGHYVAYVKCGDQWYSANDSTVDPCDIKKVPFDDCSILSFRRLQKDA